MLTISYIKAFVPKCFVFSAIPCWGIHTYALGIHTHIDTHTHTHTHTQSFGKFRQLKKVKLPKKMDESSQLEELTIIFLNSRFMWVEKPNLKPTGNILCMALRHHECNIHFVHEF